MINQDIKYHNLMDMLLIYFLEYNHKAAQVLLTFDVITSAERRKNAENTLKQLLDLVEETIPVPMIISDYSEKSDSMLNPFEGKEISEFDGMIKVLYDMYIQNGFSPNEAAANIANTEPFIYNPEKVIMFCEKEGIKYEFIFVCHLRGQ